MNFVIQFLIILGFSFAGEFLHWLLPLPIPAGIYGILLLFAALELKLVKVADIRDVSAFLITAMPVMFIPAAAGLMESWGIIADSPVPYVLITFLTTFIVMGVSGAVTQFIIRKGKKK